MCHCLTSFPVALLLLQALAAALLLAGAVGVWYSATQQQPTAPSPVDPLIAALDREAANSTGRYWFGDPAPTAAGASQAQEIPRPPKA